MKVYYLHHSGFVVNIDNTSLIFDPITDIPEKFLKQNRVFFVSHVHGDHFNKKLLQKYQSPNTVFLVSDDVPTAGLGKGAGIIRRYSEISIANVNVTAFGSTDQGLSFLVTIDNKVIFFSGDLNWWAWDPKTRPHINPEVEERDYKQEIAKIKQYINGGWINLAFVPVDPRLDLPGGELWAAQYFIKELKPEKLVPMHFWGDFGVIKRLRDSLGKDVKTEIGQFDHKNQEVTF